MILVAEFFLTGGVRPRLEVFHIRLASGRGQNKGVNNFR